MTLGRDGAKRTRVLADQRVERERVHQQWHQCRQAHPHSAHPQNKTQTAGTEIAAKVAGKVASGEADGVLSFNAFCQAQARSLRLLD